MRDSSKSGTVAIAAIVALAVGGLGGYAAANSMSEAGHDHQSNNQKAAPLEAHGSKAADLRVVLNALEREHVDLAATATRAGFDGQPHFEASAAQLDKNSVELSKAVGSVYGADAEKQFLEIWRSHIGFFVDYTVAAKAGDQAGMDMAVQNLNGYVDAISDFFSKANPNLPREDVKKLVGEHVGLLKGAVDAHGAGNHAESFAKQHEANEQIGTVADALSGAIVKQNPNKF